MALLELTIKQQKFVFEWVKDPEHNATEAYRRAGYKAIGMSAVVASSRLLNNVNIQAAIAEARQQIAEQSAITVAKVLDRFWLIANADPNELIEYRRHCCRYCYGEGNRFQRTEWECEQARSEQDIAVIKWEQMSDEERIGKPTPGAFDDAGGIGWDPRRDPVQSCPRCFGSGVEEAFAKDTRKLSRAGRALYAGVKVTSQGLEIKMQNQQEALVNAGKIIGAFVESGSKSPVTIVNNVQANASAEAGIDLNRLTDDELSEYERLCAAARGIRQPMAAAGQAGPDPVHVPNDQELHSEPAAPNSLPVPGQVREGRD